MNKLRPGAVISARELITIGSMRIRLPDPTGVVHLQFRRYAGCPFCDLHLRSIVQRHQELVAAGIREVVVSSPRRRSSSPNRVTCRSPSSPTPQTVAGAALGGLVATTVFLVPR